MDTPEYEDAVATLRSAVLDGLTKRAHLTGLRAGRESDMMLADIVETLLEPPLRRAGALVILGS
jgi:hypothetical protein